MSNINNENNNNNSYYYNNSNEITIMKCRIKVFFGVFRQFSAYFGLSSNRRASMQVCFIFFLHEQLQYGGSGDPDETVAAGAIGDPAR